MFPRRPTNPGNSDPAKITYLVHGTVLNPNGRPFAGGIVRAFDRDLRSEQLLGESRTDAQGYYEIRYSAEKFAQAEAGSADLAVKVFSARGQVLYEPTAADIVYNAPVDAVVDITLTTGDTRVDSEIERMVRDVTPLLQDVRLENLQEDKEHQDITFLNKETGWPAEALEMVVMAFRVGSLAKVDPAFFYALLRRQSLFKINLASAVQAHFAITLASDPRGILYEAVLMDPEVIRREVKAAIAAALVPAALADQLDQILKQLAAFQQEAQDYQRKQVPGQVLNLVQANLAAGKEQEVIQILQQDAGGDFAGLIQKLSQVSLFTSPDAANQAGTKLQLADLLGFDNRVIDSVRQIQGLQKPEDLRKLAALNKADWQNLLTKSAQQITAGGKPLDPSLAGLHASALVRKMEARYPTAAFAAQLGRDEKNPLPQRVAVASFLDANPNFNLAATPVERYLKAAAPGSLPQADTQALKDNLKTVQRVFKLAPVYSQTQALLNDGIQSAQQVVQMGETQFVKKYSASAAFTKKQAQAAYQKAADVHTAAMLLAAELKSYGDAAPIAAIGSPAAADVMAAYAEDFPNLKSLFQLTDVCECDECRTVHSAAAYLVDVLQFLKNRKVMDKTVSPAVERTAREVLLARRPDVADLDLNCENTNTSLPYIDVVCELLEDLVAPDPGIPYSGPLAAGLPAPALMTAVSTLPFTDKAFVAGPDGAGNYILRDQKVVCKLTPNGADWTIHVLHQTHLSAEELGAAPEYLNDAAYTTLQGAHIAFSLPFDLYHRESQAYLEKFDVAHPALMKALQVPGTPQDFEIAADALGFSDEERVLVVTPDTANQQTYWNTAASPASGEMQVVDTFLTRTGLDYPDLLDLLKVKFINPPNPANPDLELFIKHLDSSCDTTQKQIANLDDAALDRFHRFIRLWRVTGLGLQDLDRAILSARLGGGLLDDACLVRLNDLLSLAEQLSLDMSEACTLFGTLPDEDESSRYYQVFLNKAALGTVDAHFQPAYVAQNELNEQAVPGSGDKLSAYQDALALCLGLKAEEVSILIGMLPVIIATPANQLHDLLSFASMAGLYALALLSRKLGLKVSDLAILQSLTVAEILESPADNLRFVEQAGKVGAAGIKPVDLRYLLEHQADDLGNREIKDSWVTSLLESLQKDYQAAFTSNKSPFDPGLTADENKGALKDILSRLTAFSADDLTQFMRIVDGEWLTPTGTVGTFIDDKLADTVDTTAIKAAEVALAAAPSDGTRNTFIQSVLDALSAFFYAQAKGSILAQGVMAAFKISENLTAALLLLAHLKEPLSAGGKTLAELLSSDDLVDKVNPVPAPPAVTSAAFPHQYEAVRLLSVMAPWLATLPLKSEDVAWMLTHNADLGWLELDRLPYQTGISSLSFSQWESFSDVLAWIQAYPPVANPADPTQPYTSYMFFETVLNPAATLNDVANALATLAGWDPQVVLDLDARFGLSVPDLSAYKLPATLEKLSVAMIPLRQLGLDVADGVSLIKAVLGPADTKLLRQALKQRYAEADWLGVLKNIQDGLREEKRDALVAYILATKPEFKTADDLYETYLIDVEMSACQPTSRIVQAHGTLQLFVQRCLMGVEQGAVVDVTVDLFWEQWKWMKNYRVWEANRKIFLYPENWIEPELRDDKSFFYQDVENALLQNELTDQAVEDAAVNYLEDLDEVAFLDVSAVYYDTQRSEMHVFARTKGGEPATYYHRVFEQERRWTPWDKVDLDITGDHLLAFMRNSRLFLAWPVFTTQANTEQSVTIPNPTQLPTNGQEADHPKKHYDVQIAISQYTGKKWLPKKLSKDPLHTVEYESLPSKENFRFTLMNLGAAGYYILCTYIDNGRFTIQNGYVTNYNTVIGSFSLTGCKGIPEAFPWNAVIGNFKYLPVFRDTDFLEQRYREMNQIAGDDLYMLTIFNLTGFGLVNNTPGTFKVTYPEQMSLIDLLLLLWEMLVYKQTAYVRETYREGIFVPLGTLMPFFYGDSSRGYTIIPGFFQTPEEEKEAGQVNQRTFSDILKFAQTAVDLVMRYYAMWIQKQFPDFNALWQALVKDEDFVWLSEEFAAYQKLHFGHRFKNFYHPLVCYLRETLYKDGIPALMKRQAQLYKTNFVFGPGATYDPTSAVIPAYPIEDLDFSQDGSYSSYNWELFFHLPFEIAVQLSKDQQFESAMEWFHYIFNPTGALDGDVPEKYWVTRPFYEHTLADYVKQRIDTIMNDLAADPSGSSISELASAVAEWREKPFMPHVIARARPVAYQKAVVMKYIQNLIDWGDYLFRQDTMESVNQATQMYVLAEKLLGPRPRIVPPVVDPPPETYNQLEPKVDLFGNALLDLENLVPDLGLLPHGGAELPPPPLTLSSLYFCIPMNEQMLAVWDTVADRLFKIRNCQNIDGVERILALFAPPIDPGALVRAAAAGLDISSILVGMNAPLPYYRFSVLSQKATELAQQVNALGSGLLQALEKKDAEGLALLRSGLEIKVLQAVKGLKTLQVEEAQDQIAALKKSVELTQEKYNFYSTRPFMNSQESTASDLNTAANVAQAAAMALDVAAGAAHLIPALNIGASGFGGSPHAAANWGGLNLGNSSLSFADVSRALAGILSGQAGLAATQGSYQRRKDDWDFQARLAQKELDQLNAQIVAAQVRQQIAEKDLQNQMLQIENGQKLDEYMRSKYTNQDLYTWMVGQISTVFFQAYKLASDMARKAERTYQHELGRSDTYIQFGYWDSMKKGLLSGEKLLYDIKRMEAGYLDQNKREYELTRHFSLALLDPLALAQLKSTGACNVNLPEALFDLDYPGQYMRRIKTVSLSLPCVVGPYTTVGCKLSLVSNKYRKNTNLLSGGSDADKYKEQAGGDERFVYNIGTIQSIATSGAQNDSGLFELNFHDERYLPFEGAGAVGTWRIEMPSKFRQFDPNTITDVIIHLKYTARDGGSTFRTTVENALRDLLNVMDLHSGVSGLYRSFNLRQEFPENWYQLKTTNSTTLTLGADKLPYFSAGHTPTVASASWVGRLTGSPTTYAMQLDAVAFNLNKDPNFGGLCKGDSAAITLGTAFTLSAASTTDLEDLLLVVKYSLSS
jgi:hypothetical protein